MRNESIITNNKKLFSYLMETVTLSYSDLMLTSEMIRAYDFTVR